jgi:hypothetical protein
LFKDAFNVPAHLAEHIHHFLVVIMTFLHVDNF